MFKETEEIVEVGYEVDPHLEIAEIHRRVASANGPALLLISNYIENATRVQRWTFL